VLSYTLVPLWFLGTGVVTFDGPFTESGNGYFCAWGAFFMSGYLLWLTDSRRSERIQENQHVQKKLQLLSQKQECREGKEVEDEISKYVKLTVQEISVFLPPIIGEQKSVHVPENEKPKVNLLSTALKASGLNFQVVGKGESSDLKNLCNLNAASPTLEVVFPRTGGSTWYDGNYESISKPTKMDEFKSQFQAMVAEAIGCSPSEVIILRVSQSSVKIDYTVLCRELNTANYEGIEELKKINQSVKATINYYTGRTVYANYKEPCYKLSPDDFDHRGDFHFPCADGDKQVRGGLDYYQPSNKWQRIGLRVLDLYDGPEGWLKMDGNENEWAVAFHGIGGSKVPYVISKVIKEKMRPGPNQLYSQYKAVDGETIGKGIYCTPKLEVAEEYASKCEQFGTKVIIQARVRPDAIRDCGVNDYWVINNHEDIRPYGLIILSAVEFKQFNET